MLYCLSINILPARHLYLMFIGLNHRFPRVSNLLELNCKIHDLTMSSLLGTSPFQQVPTAGQPQGPPAVDPHTSSMPFETCNNHAFGPSPEVSPSPSRANSVRQWKKHNHLTEVPSFKINVHNSTKWTTRLQAPIDIIHKQLSASLESQKSRSRAPA